MLSTAWKPASSFSNSALFPHQQRAVDFIKETPFCALFAGMGTGKTLATATATQELLFSFEVFKVLIVAPKRVAQFTWPDEFKKWGHLILDWSLIVGNPNQRAAAAGADCAVHIVNVENLEWLVKHHGAAWPYDMVVVDESSLFKSNNTKRFRALKKVRPKLSRVVLLSGTPAPNSLLDLWPQFFLLDQGERLMRTFTAFRDHYFESDYMGYKWTLRKGSEAEIHERVGDITLRLDTADYIDLPPVQISERKVQIPKGVLRDYERLEKDALIELAGETIAAPSAGALVNKLLQHASGALYVDETRRWSPVHSSKIDALKEIVETSAGEPILVAYSFRHELERLRAHFPDAVTIDEPNALREWNRGHVPMLLAHPASAGHGLNLQHGGRIIVWFGLSWSLELYQQFNARLHRQGQRETVFVNHLVVEGTIEETVLDVLRHKDRGQAALLDALKKRAHENGWV